ncbi:TFIIH C1-like domain containing protein [Trema orientale]|uniref:TFIIH C1-like domain containing protein n=1 Tax=Trema orientale TaxID=63057 RepID=A0A2P5E9Z9_TREOI|nr:TFIIH C1-like domain containing protein [Trema orientale]
MEKEAGGGGGGGEERPIFLFRDIRRYFCEYCGICRSKKSLIASHILTHHKEELDKARTEEEGDATEGVKGSNTCEECGVTFKKPAYLKQHMQSHSPEYQVGRPPEKLHQEGLNHATFLVFVILSQRPYVCSVDDCRSSYRRKDHLTRHLLGHKGKLFKCSIENCRREFSIQGNMKRHVREQHNGDNPSTSTESEKQYVCQEAGCGKAFRFASKLRKHEDSHVKLDSVEAVCAEPGCMKIFTNEQCLKEHIHSCHQHITCEVCGTKQLKKNLKRHLRTHEEKGPVESIKCMYKGCDHTFSTKSNLNQHVKAAHLKQKPFVCSFSGCGARFSYKHVRDNHEKTGCHVYTHGDFEEADEQFRSRPRGGRKRKYPTVEMLVRKRVSPPNQLDGSFGCFSNFLCQDEEQDEP